MFSRAFAAAARHVGRSSTRAHTYAPTRLMHSMRKHTRALPYWAVPVMAGGLGVTFLGPMTLAEQSPEEKEKEKEKEKEPASGKKRREEYKYIIVGGGPAAYGALQGIRKMDKEGTVLIITEEYHPPYARAALSKELFAEGSDSFTLTYKDGDNKSKSIFYLTAEGYENPTKLYTGLSLDALDLETRLMRVSDGSIFKYEKLLLATGCRPETIQVPVADGIEGNISSFYKIDDYRRLHHAEGDVLVYGGGFLGAEVACALNYKGKCNRRKVTLVCEENSVLDSRLPTALSEHLTRKLKESGVDVITSASITGIANGASENEAPQPLVVIRDNKTDAVAEVKTNHVVVAMGSRPNTEIGHVAGLEVDNVNGGLVVNPDFQARGHVWVAGDLASYYDVLSGTRVRGEGYEHAIHSGFVAGENMGVDGYYTGQARKYREMAKPITAKEAHEISPDLPLMMPYRHIPMFWSDIGSLGVSVEAVGRIDSTMDTVTFHAGKGEPEKGIVFYLEDRLVKGVLLWNVDDQVDTARIVVKLQRKYKDVSSLRKLPIMEGLGKDVKSECKGFTEEKA